MLHSRAKGVPLSHGVSAISGSMFAFVIADTTLKVLGQTFPTNELIFLRSVSEYPRYLSDQIKKVARLRLVNE